MDPGWTVDELTEASLELLRRTGLGVRLSASDHLPRLRRDGRRACAGQRPGGDRGLALGVIPR